VDDAVNVFLLQTINFLDFHVRFDLFNFDLWLDFIHRFAFVYILIYFRNWSWLLLSFNSLFFFHFLNPECDLILDLLLGVFDGLNLIILWVSLAQDVLIFFRFGVTAFWLNLKWRLNVWDDSVLLLFFLNLSYFAAAFLLMLGHVPFRDVLFLAVLTDKWSNSSMLPQMHFKVWSSVVFFVTAIVLAMELVNIYMCFFVVPQNPLLTEFWFATRVAADELLKVLFVVCSEMVY